MLAKLFRAKSTVLKTKERKQRGERRRRKMSAKDCLFSFTILSILRLPIGDQEEEEEEEEEEEGDDGGGEDKV